MRLNFITSGSGYPLIILHGLFGMLDNWKTMSRELEKNFTVYLIDQRNHGRSPHTPDHSYHLMSDDLLAFFEQQQITSANIIGHSMGAKTAMQFALDHPEKVRTLIVVDMGIKRYTGEGGNEAVFDALFSMDLSSIHYRADAEKILLEKIPDFSTRQFILKNLTRNPADGSYSWKFNFKALYENYASGILAPVTSNHVYNGDTLFVRGENSDYIQDADWPAIQELFPKAKLVTVSGAGHWVHADKPLALLQHVQKFLQ